MMPSQPVLPEGVQLESLLKKLRPLCWGAADILRAYARGEKPPFGFSRILDVDQSSEGPVSAADLAVNTWLLNGLKSEFPKTNWTLLSEETAKTELSQDEVIDAEWLWILDPLDGTKDFLQGSGEYAVHLGLVHLNRPVFGVVLLPEDQQLWFGVVGVGAWGENRKGEKTPASFSKREHENDISLVTSRNHRDQRLESLLKSLPYKREKVIGSVGCKVIAILRGEADLYISLSGNSAPKDWDMAGPEAVLISAGGSFTHANGAPLLYNNGDICQEGCLIATHGIQHSQICEKIKALLLDIDPNYQL